MAVELFGVVAVGSMVVMYALEQRSHVYVIGFAVAFLTGVAMVVTRAPQLLFNMISVICMMLGNAMGVSWDLLVEVGKLKAEMARVHGVLDALATSVSVPVGPPSGE